MLLLFFGVLSACSKKDQHADNIAEQPEPGGVLFYATLKSKSTLQTVYTDKNNVLVDYTSPSKVNMSLRIFGNKERYFYGSAYYGRCLYNAGGIGSYCTLAEFKSNGQVAQWAPNIGTYGEVSDMAFFDDYVIVASPDINSVVTLSIFNKNDLNTRLRQVRSLKDPNGQTVSLKCGNVTAFNNRIYASNPNGEEVFVFDKDYLLDANVKGNSNLNIVSSIGKRGQFFDLTTNNADPSILGKVKGLHHAFGYLFINSQVGDDRYKMDIYKDEKYVKSILQARDWSGNTYSLDNTSSVTEIADKYLAILCRPSGSGPVILLFDKDEFFKSGSEPIAITDMLSIPVNGDVSALNIATFDGEDLIVNRHADRTLYVYKIRIKQFNKD